MNISYSITSWIFDRIWWMGISVKQVYVHSKTCCLYFEQAINWARPFEPEPRLDLGLVCYETLRLLWQWSNSNKRIKGKKKHHSWCWADPLVRHHLPTPTHPLRWLRPYRTTPTTRGSSSKSLFSQPGRWVAAQLATVVVVVVAVVVVVVVSLSFSFIQQLININTGKFRWARSGSPGNGIASLEMRLLRIDLL